MKPEAWSALASSIGVIVAIVTLAVQDHRTRFSNAVTILSQLDNQFDSAEFRIFRRQAAKHLLEEHDTNSNGAESLSAILNFFENLGFLHSRRAVDSDAVWHFFAAWLLPYFRASEGYIDERRALDASLFGELRTLYYAVLQHDRVKNGFAASEAALSDSMFQSFLRTEAS